MVNAIRYESIHQWTMFASYYGRCGRMKKKNDHAEPTKVGTLKTKNKQKHFIFFRDNVVTKKEYDTRHAM